MTCTTIEASLEVASNEERVEADDVKLLQEILSDDGLFIDGTKEVLQWHDIHKRLQSGGMDVSEHSLKRRLKTIYDTFCVAERTSQRASGVEEPLDEKTQLLQEYHELLCERQASEAEKRRQCETPTRQMKLVAALFVTRP
ncbi:hypothetical protein LEN26_004832 [Aphanomyces euteiches]|nr:hypothetical protein LEN26_004832 [Aphanomyces euteiches]